MEKLRIGKIEPSFIPVPRMPETSPGGAGVKGGGGRERTARTSVGDSGLEKPSQEKPSRKNK